MKTEFIANIFASILAAVSASADPASKLAIGITQVGRNTDFGEVRAKRELKGRSADPCQPCTPGTDQCAGDNGCYSCNRGPYVFQIQDPLRCDC
ncbi:hypothetical protein BDZ45DRAFT_740378 [Acephala macrosclerotiorum]|nr:hypothetical protein BDZ45DRAFT_740378 [Acephala macrosclerotiorum]